MQEKKKQNEKYDIHEVWAVVPIGDLNGVHYIILVSMIEIVY